MIPPFDHLVLQANPDFARLYDSLTNDVLTLDGSTKNDPGAKQRDETRLVSQIPGNSSSDSFSVFINAHYIARNLNTTGCSRPRSISSRMHWRRHHPLHLNRQHDNCGNRDLSPQNQ